MVEVCRVTLLPQATCSELLRQPGPELSGFLRGDQLGNGVEGRKGLWGGHMSVPSEGPSCTCTAPRPPGAPALPTCLRVFTPRPHCLPATDLRSPTLQAVLESARG